MIIEHLAAYLRMTCVLPIITTFSSFVLLEIVIKTRPVFFQLEVMKHRGNSTFVFLANYLITFQLTVGSRYICGFGGASERIITFRLQRVVVVLFVAAEEF